MDEKYLIAPCGVDCFNCEAYEKNITESTAKHICEMSGRAYKDGCKGCRSMNGRNLPLADECKTFQCVNRHEVEFCSECPDFPCDKLAPCADKANLVPQNLKVFNLCRMNKVGIDKWLEESKSIRERYFKGEFVPGRGSIVRK